MFSVTGRISKIKQPRGGYIRPKMFDVENITVDEELRPTENIHGSIVGTAVDYLSRLESGTDPRNAFRISLMGARLAREEDKAVSLLESVVSIDNDDTIVNACKLVGYDAVYRAGYYTDVDSIEPDDDTIYNIRVLVKRVLAFFDKYGPVVKDGFTFEGGYTDIISSGDGDLLTEDTLWDLKVVKTGLTSKYTLQVLIYYLMGLNSIHPEFQNITKLGFVNPRLNKVYTLSVDKIPKEVIAEVNREVIGYTV